ncbi:hypothetical protein H6G54_03160 [Anabaena cylindrica FACHB-243]|uniref:hypothetical protein n=1 Tax=Anabaena TaxID=1163 RepID=UPI000319018F|nr:MULTISPECIES: hypothetical protein [Anabaena]MBD2416724.1 hypothetical protein [Anabaena cylindrica FACHB-243]MBY5285024.1 hypothetical protein [Anabaena sp. CCAP 1446/1C]MBY5310339.1 hypothetical protein [Anabaena sp. CCAP 1446/1C]MCM2409855.1 hypothetical protein [Anabaena sp. CCAP 1446/1C]BAY03051.1 hypothetical protein NIES19_23010 [Anabaena cylindrica PCC 7122]
MLSNPHIYPQISDTGGNGTIEQQLIILAVKMAESLIRHNTVRLRIFVGWVEQSETQQMPVNVGLWLRHTS